MIIYTGRYKRIDNFWFTVAHEIAHVLLHLNDENTFVLDNLRTGERNKMEEEANDLAAEKLMHNEIANYLNPYLSDCSSIHCCLLNFSQSFKVSYFDNSDEGML